MGKLAERLADASRSGVYRVESTEALEEAVGLNGFALARVPSTGIPAGAARDGEVILIEAHAVNGALHPVIENLEARAAAARKAQVRFFAVFLDPRGELPLAPLYNWKRR